MRAGAAHLEGPARCQVVARLEGAPQPIETEDWDAPQGWDAPRAGMPPGARSVGKERGPARSRPEGGQNCYCTRIVALYPT